MKRMSATINNTTMKKVNRGLVFKNLVITQGMSRAELARQLSLTKMTITNIVTEFLEKGFVVEQEKIVLGQPHKNPTRIELSGTCPKIIAVQIQRNYCKAALTDFHLNVLEIREVQYENICLEKLKETLEQLLVGLLENGSVLGIGVGSIGPIDARAGVICNPLNFGDIQNFAVADYLEKKFHLPVILEHHYNCALLAEHYFGVGQQSGNLIYLGITKGVGMGGMVGNQLYSSFLGCITEIGHVSVDRHGRLCRCGSRGCMETYVSTDVMLEELRKITGQKKNFREFCGMTEDHEVMQYFYGIMEYLRAALVSVINLFRPDMVIIGDEGRFLPDSCIVYLEEEINRFHLYSGKLYVKVQKTSIRDKDLLTASSAMGIIEKVFQGEIMFE